jgi:hypothetical protein
MTLSPRLEAFLAALPNADDNALVNPPGLGGVWRVRAIRLGIERHVLAVDRSGNGFNLVQPSTHGACEDCKGRKGSQPCIHCRCALCQWLVLADEHGGPRASRQKVAELAARLQAFAITGPKQHPLDEGLA